MTGVRVAVALALPAIGEVPVAGLALVAPPPERGLVRVTQTLKHRCSTTVHNSCLHLSGFRLAELVLAALVVAVAPLAPAAGEPERGGSAGVAHPPRHQLLAVAVAVVLG